MVNYEHGSAFMEGSVDKQIVIENDEGTIRITNDELHNGEFELQESLCSGRSLSFGAAEAATVSFTVSNALLPMKGQWINISMVVDGHTESPLSIGRYLVDSDKPTADRKKRNVVAYDALCQVLQADVAGWYNTLLPNKDSTTTLKAFRDSFFEYFGIAQESVSLVNDHMTVEKTIEPEELSGKTVLNCICEINGCFGHIGRDGIFKYVCLTPIQDGLYPDEVLYPSETLYPKDQNRYFLQTGQYISATYEDYLVEPITKLQIRQEEDDIGCIVGNGDNAYVIQDNFLVYGKSAEELEEIATLVFGKICGIYYRPFSAKARGNPCLEVGDGISLGTRYASIHSYILQRTLRGIQALRDEYAAEGEQYQPTEVNSVNRSIQQLKGKTNRLIRSVEETRAEMADMEKGLRSSISVTASQIQTEIANTKSGLESSITQTASQIRSEVASVKSGLESSVTQTAKEIRSEVSDSKNGLQTQITQNANSITSEVKRATDAENALSTKITQTDEKIRFDVNETYETRVAVEEKVNAAKTSSNNYTDTKLALYSTTTQMNSAIEQSANAINISVNSKISDTKTYVETQAEAAKNSAIADTTEKLKAYTTTTDMRTEIKTAVDGINLSAYKTIKSYDEDMKSYSTTEEMGSAIKLAVNGIDLSVFYKKTDVDGKVKTLESSIKANAAAIELKVSNGTISSSISQEAGKIAIKSNRISISSTYFSLAENGKITATEVDLTGKITAESGEIGGFTITDDSIYNGSKSSLTSTYDGIYLGTDGVACGSKFKVTKAGILTATDVELAGKITAVSGEIGGFTITDDSIYNGSKSSLTSTYDGIYLGTDGVACGSKFKVTKAGILTATDVELAGKITAVSGEIGGFTITDDSIYNGSKSSLTSTYDGIYLGTDGVACGSKFKVTKAGVLTATDVELTGKITAESGKIGGFTITASSIYSGNKSTLASTYSGIYIGTDGISAGGKFKINTSGEMAATGGTIGGFTIDSDSIHSGYKSSLTANYDGVYIGTDGISIGYGSKFKVTSAGAAYFSDVEITGNGSIAFSYGSNSMKLNYNGISFGSDAEITSAKIRFGNTYMDSGGLTIRGSNWFEYLQFTGDRSAGYLNIGTTTAIKFSAGQLELPLSTVIVGKSTGNVGFFGSSGTVKKTISVVSTTGTVAQVATKLNELLTALKGYGLIA